MSTPSVEDYAEFNHVVLAVLECLHQVLGD